MKSGRLHLQNVTYAYAVTLHTILIFNGRLAFLLNIIKYI